MTVWLVRHAPVAMTGVCYGQIDVATTMDASGAADAVASALAHLGPPPCAVYTSPFRRTRDVARVLAARWAVPCHVDARLAELAFGDWEGRLYADIERTDDARFRHWLDNYEHTAPPGGETTAALVARARDFLSEATAGPDAVLAVTHAGFIRAACSLKTKNPYAAHALAEVPHLCPIAFP
jgi:alpha-ribazole phosphatase